MRSAERAKAGRGEGGGGGGYELLDAGSGGDSTLLPLAKAERLLGVASRMMIFMLCLEGGAAGMRRHTPLQLTAQTSDAPGRGFVD